MRVVAPGKPVPACTRPWYKNTCAYLPLVKRHPRVLAPGKGLLRVLAPLVGGLCALWPRVTGRCAFQPLVRRTASARFQLKQAQASCTRLTHQKRDDPQAVPLWCQRIIPPGVLTPVAYSHSIVPGGFDVTSRTTRLTPGTSLVMRLEMRASTSYGRRVQSAVIASSDETGRSTMGCP